MNQTNGSLDYLIEIGRQIVSSGDIYIDTYGLLKIFNDRYDNMPSTRELGIMIDAMEGKPLGRTGPRTASARLDAMERHGYIRREVTAFSGSRRARITFVKA